MGPKRLFEVTVALPTGALARSKVWLVLAEREEEARSLIPGGGIVEFVRSTVEHRAARGPSRVIGWTIGDGL